MDQWEGQQFNKSPGNLYSEVGHFHLISAERIKMKVPHFTIEISRRLIELLSFPLVHVAPDGVAVGARKPGVHVKQRLHVVVTRWNLTDRLQRIAQCECIQRDGLPWL